MLYLIGTGIRNNLSLEVINILKKCQKIYLENYTSILQGSLDIKAEKVDRAFVENFDVTKAENEDIAFLIIGDVFAATTHISLFNDSKEKNVEVKVFNNASIITAVGITGLSLYNFGKIASIPFGNEKVETPFNILEDNKKINAHTLFLLDLDSDKGRVLSIKDAIEYLEKRKFKGKVIGCGRLGSDDFIVKYGNIKKVKDYDFGEGPYCLIVPSDKLHFMEEEVLRKWEVGM